MKKRILLLVMVLLFTLSLGTSALATRDYGVIYDETEMLGSDNAGTFRERRRSRSSRRRWASTFGWMC